MARFLDQHLGPYIGTVSRDDLMKALEEHVPGSVVTELEAPDGSTVVHTQGPVYMNEGHVIIGGVKDREVLAEESFPVRGLNTILRVPMVPQAERYTDGFRVALPGRLTLAIVLWRDVLHVTDSGDVAPGPGPVDIEGGDA